MMHSDSDSDSDTINYQLSNSDKCSVGVQNFKFPGLIELNKDPKRRVKYLDLINIFAGPGYSLSLRGDLHGPQTVEDGDDR